MTINRNMILILVAFSIAIVVAWLSTEIHTDFTRLSTRWFVSFYFSLSDPPLATPMLVRMYSYIIAFCITVYNYKCVGLYMVYTNLLIATPQR